MSCHSTISDLRQRNEAALITYLTAGFPTLEKSVEQFLRIVDGGADLIEVGVPFSDPVADGPTIQRASRVALENGCTLDAILSRFSELDCPTPRILMSYTNPILVGGVETRLREIAAAGFCGCIIPDLPLEESHRWRSIAAQQGLEWIPLIAPTSLPSRALDIAATATGFSYYVSVTGTTGARNELPQGLESRLDELRGAIQSPLAVGFGIRDSTQVRQLAAHCDGIVVGSRIVDAIQRNEPIEALVRELKQATKETARC